MLCYVTSYQTLHGFGVVVVVISSSSSSVFSAAAAAAAKLQLFNPYLDLLVLLLLLPILHL